MYANDTNLSNAISAVLSLFLTLTVSLACSINLGEDAGGGKTGESKKITALSGEEVGSLKKAVVTKSSKKSGRTSENADAGDFVPIYSEIKNGKYADFNQRFKEQKVIEDITDSLNEALALPTDVKVTFRDCGQPNAFYRPDEKSITMCYEFMELFNQI